MDTPANSPSSASSVLLAVYWLIVVIPLGWGVYQTVQKSIPLFHVTSAPAAAVPADAASTPPVK